MQQPEVDVVDAELVDAIVYRGLEVAILDVLLPHLRREKHLLVATSHSALLRPTSSSFLYAWAVSICR
jgi:hypothetical protein